MLPPTKSAPRAVNAGATATEVEVPMRAKRIVGMPAERFWAKVEKTETCWLWTASMHRGYGRLWRGDGTTVRAHRFAYELLVGPIPDGLQIDHLCRNRRCVNPAHLEAVTQRENVLRGVGLSATNARKTHCKRGHEFTPENTYRSVKGRECRTCRRAAKTANAGAEHENPPVGVPRGEVA